MVSSGISGQAVLEGVLMKNNSKYALAVRKPNNDIEVVVERYNSIKTKNKFFGFPLIRGIVSFFEEVYLGIKNFSVIGKYYDKDEEVDKESGKGEVLQLLIAIAVISLAIGIFVALPFGLSLAFGKLTDSDVMLAVIEGIMRLVLLVIYVVAISMLPDIKRLYMYIGAGHKAMNCASKGIPLTVSNVRRMSRKNYKCGNVFMITVIMLSVILFMFIRIESIWLRLVFRLLIVPVISAFTYEVMELASKTDSALIKVLNLPGILVHEVITDEPAEDMIELVVKSAEAVEDVKELVKEAVKGKKKKTDTAKAGIKRVSKHTPEKKENNKKNKKTQENKAVQLNKTDIKNEKLSEVKTGRDKRLAERARMAVTNKEDKRVSASPIIEDEDDEILNALNHFFNSKKEEEKKKGKRR